MECLSDKEINKIIFEFMTPQEERAGYINTNDYHTSLDALVLVVEKLFLSRIAACSFLKVLSEEKIWYHGNIEWIGRDPQLITPRQESPSKALAMACVEVIRNG